MSLPALRELISAQEILVTPGCFDALSALLVERAGFRAAYLSGASVAYTQFGRPDVGLVTMDEMALAIARIRERISIPLIVDADTGFGNALNTQRTVRSFERMGAAAIQLEDQQFPKRCGHLAGKSLIPASEMAGKVRAACDARDSRDTLVVARTDAIAVEGLAAALDRADCYLAAGADVLFIEALRDEADMRAAVRRFGGRAPLLVNIVEGGKTPALSARELQALGFAVAIYPGSLVRALAFAGIGMLATLKREGGTRSYAGGMLDFKQLQQLLGTDELLAAGKRYENGTPESK